MGLFDKKYCDVCGQKIGLLGNRKLADGNLCKNCAAKLSPWFSDRKKSTVDEIRQQLDWREENKEKVAAFSPTRKIGKGNMLLIDEAKGQFTVTSAADLVKDNPDILSLSDVTGCNLDTQEHRHEIYRKDKDGKSVSYNPPRYEYSYDFYCTIFVNNPYYTEMKFRLNTLSVKIENGAGRTGGSGLGMGLFQPNGDAQYRQYTQMGEEMRAALLAAKNGQQSGYGTYGGKQPQYSQQAPQYGAQPQAQPQYTRAQPQYVQMQPQATPAGGSWLCPGCGAQNTGKFCENCGTPRPA